MNASTNVIGYMSRAPVLVSIKPSVFFWLLDKSGWTIPEIASKIEYDETEIQKWKKENETIKLPLSQVEIVSKTIKRLGMKDGNGGTGALMIIFKVVYPDKLTKEQIEKLCEIIL